MAKTSVYQEAKKLYPRSWWLFLVPSVIFYGALMAGVVAWCNYRADMSDLEAREAIVQQRQEEALRVERYKARMATQQKQRRSYDVRNAVDR